MMIIVAGILTLKYNTAINGGVQMNSMEVYLQAVLCAHFFLKYIALKTLKIYIHHVCSRIYAIICLLFVKMTAMMMAVMINA